jgi:predicted CXXCH cytochrome family protein
MMRGTAFGESSSDSGEVCVFCHTPMVSDSTLGRAPLWQRSVDGASAFPTYDDIGRSGTSGSTAVGSQSLACLSCHDSNQAFSVTRSSMEHPYGVPYRGSFPTAAGPTTTLQRLHARGNTLIDPGRSEGLAEFRPAYRGVIDDRSVWWASSSGNSARRGRGDLPLYGRVDAESGVPVPHIECATCHDPHSANRMFLRTAAASGELCITCHNN